LFPVKGYWKFVVDVYYGNRLGLKSAG